MKDDKELYELLNDIEINEEDFVEVEVSELEKMKVKNKLKKTIKKKSYKKYINIAAIAGITLVGTTFITKPAIAYDIPILGDLLLEKKIERKEYAEYTEIIGKTQKSGDIEITLVSAVADKNKLEVSYEIKDRKGRLDKESQLASDISHFLRGQVYINEIDIMRSGGGDFKYVDNNTMLHSYSYNLPSIELGDELNINIKLNELLGKKGDFGFKFKLNTEKINEDTISLKNIKVENPNIKINTLNKTPLSIVINAEANGISDLVAMDNNGKPLKGGWKGYSGDTKENHFEYIPNENMEWIEFIPVISKLDKIPEETPDILEKTIPLDFNFKDKKLELTDYRGIIIHEVIKHGDYIVILYNNWVKGGFFHFSDESLYLKDGEKIIRPRYFDIEEEYIQFDQYRKDGYGLSFFKVDNFENLEIGIRHYDNYKFLTEDKFKVELKEKNK